MKVIYILLIVVVVSVLNADLGDPFVVKDSDLKKKTYPHLDSKKVLSDLILQKFGEQRLDNGNKVDVIRITILRSFHDPLMFIWTVDNKAPEKLVIKKVQRVIDKEGEITYGQLILNKKIDMTKSQSKYLKKMLLVSDAHCLNPKDWQQETLDGSTWIYEFASRGKSIVLVRRNPIEAKVGDLKIPRKRMLKESALTSMALMIWTMGNLENEELY